jgi:hypothetical protein
MNSDFAIFLLLVVALLLYFLPTVVALLRDGKGMGGIIDVKIFLGWTLLGWVGALAWAAAASNTQR